MNNNEQELLQVVLKILPSLIKKYKEMPDKEQQDLRRKLNDETKYLLISISANMGDL